MPKKSELISLFKATSISSKLAKLKPTPGYCIFIDAVGSTAMKQNQQHPWKWILGLFGTLESASISLYEFKPIKAIGDELMYYIEDAELQSTFKSPDQLLKDLCEIQESNDPSNNPLKIGAARCLDVYSVTFLENRQDYYGLGVDLAARLARDANPHEIVIERGFFDSVSDKSQHKKRFIARPPRKALKDFTDQIKEVYSFTRK